MVLTIENEADESILKGISRMDASIPEWVRENEKIKKADTRTFLETIQKSI